MLNDPCISVMLLFVVDFCFQNKFIWKKIGAAFFLIVQNIAKGICVSIYRMVTKIDFKKSCTSGEIRPLSSILNCIDRIILSYKIYF